MSAEPEWRPDGWWRVIGPDGELWCESSNEQENRKAMRPGDALWRHERRIEESWVLVLPEVLPDP